MPKPQEHDIPSCVAEHPISALQRSPVSNLAEGRPSLVAHAPPDFKTSQKQHAIAQFSLSIQSVKIYRIACLKAAHLQSYVHIMRFRKRPGCNFRGPNIQPPGVLGGVVTPLGSVHAPTLPIYGENGKQRIQKPCAYWHSASDYR